MRVIAASIVVVLGAMASAASFVVFLVQDSAIWLGVGLLSLLSTFFWYGVATNEVNKR